MSPPPETPTPRRYLLPQRATQPSRTPHVPLQFQSTPRFGSSSVPWSTQRRKTHEIEDVDEDEDKVDESSEDDEEESPRPIEPEKDPIDIDSAGSSPSHDEAVDSQALEDKVLKESQLDELEVEESKEPRFERPEPLTPTGREPKRRRLSISPAPSASPLFNDSADLNAPTDQTSRQNEENGGPTAADRDFEDTVQSEALTDLKGPQQPTFLAAPRFKPVETDAAAEGLPTAFSPHRRGVRYLAGGLAAEMQRFLSEVKGWEGVDSTPGPASRITVEGVRPGRRMYFVSAKGSDSTGGSNRYILAGDGKLTGLGPRAEVLAGSVIMIGQLVWNVELEGEVWTVACDWSVEQ